MEEGLADCFLLETEVLQNTPNPKWRDDKFVFEYRVRSVSELGAPGMVLAVECLDHHRMVRGHVIGGFEVSLATVASGPVHYDYLIRDRHGQEAGRVGFNVQMRQWRQWSVRLSAQLTLNPDALDAARTRMGEAHEDGPFGRGPSRP